MKNFLAIFIGSETSENAKKWNALDEATRNERIKAGGMAWGKWMQENGAIMPFGPGAPLGETKQINPHGITDITNNMSAYCIVSAESHEAAAKLFLSHPHFAYFPGDSVEVMECLPIPKV